MINFKVTKPKGRKKHYTITIDNSKSNIPIEYASKAIVDVMGSSNISRNSTRILVTKKSPETYLPEIRKKIYSAGNTMEGGLGAGRSIDDLAKKYKVKPIHYKKIYAAIDAGIGVEKEHTNDIERMKEIAFDHIWETGMLYYKELPKMEKKLESNPVKFEKGAEVGNEIEKVSILFENIKNSIGDDKSPYSNHVKVLNSVDIEIIKKRIEHDEVLLNELKDKQNKIDTEKKAKRKELSNNGYNNFEINSNYDIRKYVENEKILESKIDILRHNIGELKDVLELINRFRNEEKTEKKLKDVIEYVEAHMDDETNKDQYWAKQNEMRLLLNTFVKSVHFKTGENANIYFLKDVYKKFGLDFIKRTEGVVLKKAEDLDADFRQEEASKLQQEWKQQNPNTVMPREVQDEISKRLYAISIDKLDYFINLAKSELGYKTENIDSEKGKGAEIKNRMRMLALKAKADADALALLELEMEMGSGETKVESKEESKLQKFINDVTFDQLFKNEVEIPSELFDAYDEFVATGKFTYNDDVADYFIQKFNLENNPEKVKTVVYWVSQNIKKREAKAYFDKMISEGWNVLSNDELEKLSKSKAKITIDKDIKGIKYFNVVEGSDGNYVLVHSKSKKSGYSPYSSNPLYPTLYKLYSESTETKPVEIEPETAPQKEAWEISVTEYIKNKSRGKEITDDERTYLLENYIEAVEKAVSEGKPVSEKIQNRLESLKKAASQRSNVQDDVLRVDDRVIVKGKHGNPDYEGSFRGWSNGEAVVWIESIGSQWSVPKDEVTKKGTQSEPETKPKEAWEMTFDEFIESEIKSTQERLKTEYDPRKIDAYKYGLEQLINRNEIELNDKREYFHKPIIEKALSEGKPVPAEVLADYPELQKSEPETNDEVKQIEKDLISGKMTASDYIDAGYSKKYGYYGSDDFKKKFPDFIKHKKSDKNMGREWNSPYGRQKITDVIIHATGDMYVVETVDTGAERNYSVGKIEDTIKNDEYRLTDEYKVKSEEQQQLQKSIREAQERRDAELKKERDELYVFLKDSPAMQKERLTLAMLKSYMLNGKTNTLKKHIEEFIRNGAVVKTVDGERRLYVEERGFFDQKTISKVGMDYAEYLLLNKEKMSAGGFIKCPVGTQVQSVLMSKDNFSRKEAVKWVKEHDYSSEIDETENYYRFRQQEPEQFEEESFRTIEFTDGIKAVVGCPVNKAKAEQGMKIDTDIDGGAAYEGNLHTEGGIPATVKETGQEIEFEVGEIVINRVDAQKHCEELSKINSEHGKKIDCDCLRNSNKDENLKDPKMEGEIDETGMVKLEKGDSISDRQDKINSFWKNMFEEMQENKIALKVLNVKSEENADLFISEFVKSGYADKFRVSKNDINKNKVEIRLKAQHLMFEKGAEIDKNMEKTLSNESNIIQDTIENQEVEIEEMEASTMFENGGAIRNINTPFTKEDIEREATIYFENNNKVVFEKKYNPTYFFGRHYSKDDTGKWNLISTYGSPYKEDVVYEAEHERLAGTLNRDHSKDEYDMFENGDKIGGKQRHYKFRDDSFFVVDWVEQDGKQVAVLVDKQPRKKWFSIGESSADQILEDAEKAGIPFDEMLKTLIQNGAFVNIHAEGGSIDLVEKGRYYINDKGNLEMKLNYKFYQSLPEETKNKVRQNFLFSKFNKAWYRKSSITNEQAEKIAISIGISGTMEGGDNAASVVFEKKESKRLNLPELYKNSKKPRKDVIINEIKDGKMEYAIKKHFNGMTDSYDWFDVRNDSFKPAEEAIREYNNKTKENFLIEDLERAKGQSHYLYSATISKDDTLGYYINFDNYYIRYKGERGEKEDEPIVESELEAGFNYLQFDFKNKPNNHDKDFISDIKRHVEIIKDETTAPNGLKFKYKDVDFYLFDNSGEFKVDDLTNGVYIDEIYFTNDGKQKSMSELVADVIETLDEYISMKESEGSDESEVEPIGTFAGQVEPEVMSEKYTENIPVNEARKQAYQEAYRKYEMGLISLDELKSFGKEQPQTAPETEHMEKVKTKTADIEWENILLSMIPDAQKKMMSVSEDFEVNKERLISQLKAMPKLYGQDGKKGDAIAYFHYFVGSLDIYLMEFSKSDDESSPYEFYTFGSAVEGGDFEGSYAYFPDWLNYAPKNIELDYYFEPTPLRNIVDERNPYYEKEQEAPTADNSMANIRTKIYANAYEQNKAIEKFIELSGGNTAFTGEDIEFLNRYTGYGGLAKFMDAENVSRTDAVGTLYEYYTPDELCKKLWGLAYKHGFDASQLVLEPSCGIGRIIKYAPNKSLVKAYETNPTSSFIAKATYRGSDIVNDYFESEFYMGFGKRTRNKDYAPAYGLVIGNYPFGDYSGKYASMGEKDYSKATQVDHHFIVRGLDALVSGGLMVCIVNSRFMQGGHDAVKAEIEKRGELIDAYRLPAGVFQNTEVIADILVIRKK